MTDIKTPIDGQDTKTLPNLKVNLTPAQVAEAAYELLFFESFSGWATILDESSYAVVESLNDINLDQHKTLYRYLVRLRDIFKNLAATEEKNRQANQHTDLSNKNNQAHE